MSRDDKKHDEKTAFDAPRPPRVSKWKTAVIMGAGVISFGLYLVFFNTILIISSVFWVFCALFLLVEWLNGGESPLSQQTSPLTTEGLDQTRAVAFVGNKETICSRCNQTSAFDTISINEHGYFCKVCVDDIREDTGGIGPS